MLVGFCSKEAILEGSSKPALCSTGTGAAPQSPCILHCKERTRHACCKCWKRARPSARAVQTACASVNASAACAAIARTRWMPAAMRSAGRSVELGAVPRTSSRWACHRRVSLRVRRKSASTAAASPPSSAPAASLFVDSLLGQLQSLRLKASPALQRRLPKHCANSCRLMSEARVAIHTK